MLHDRPPAHFRRSTPMEQHDLFKRLEPIFHPPMPKSFTGQSSDATMFTDASRKNGPALRSDRPALLVSSTSWTADEDFSPLLTALDEYQARRDAKETLPRLMVIITGKGAMRAAFERQVALREGSKWKDICVRCVFLAARDYPTMLGCADLGISVHSSSSGRDLPMKVVDMFGCGTPVLAKGFPAIGELVQDGKNGRIWNTAEELASQMIVSHLLRAWSEAIERISSNNFLRTPHFDNSRTSLRCKTSRPDRHLHRSKRRQRHGHLGNGIGTKTSITKSCQRRLEPRPLFLGIHPSF